MTEIGNLICSLIFRHKYCGLSIIQLTEYKYRHNVFINVPMIVGIDRYLQ